MKKLVVAVFAVVAAMALCVPALAFAADDASITIKPHGTDTQTDTTQYNYYEIFIADIGSLGTVNQSTGELSGDPGKVAYYIPHNTAGDALKNAIVAKNSTMFTFTLSADQSRWVVGLADDSTTAAAIVAVLGDSTVTAKALKTGSFTMGESEAVANNLQPGYYVVTSTLGTKIAVQTLGNVTINEKNEYIVDDKVAETASVTIGESATYYIKVFLPSTIDTTKLVTVHDEMAAELSFNNDLQVAVSDTDPGSTAAAYAALTYGDLGSAYSVKTSSLGDACDFHIDITTTGLAGKYVVFKFSAKLLATADPDGDGFVNKEWSSYPNYTTEPSQPRVKTYQFDVLKTDKDGNKLDGAEFQLHKGTADGEVFKFVEVGGAGTGVYKKTADASGTDTLVVNSKTLGKATKVQGLGAGTYYLVETKPATGGYNLLTAPIIITVTDAGQISATLNGQSVGSGKSGSVVLTVINQAGTQLPSTGGIGTTIFYIVGAILVIGAGVVLITKRRIRKGENKTEL